MKIEIFQRTVLILCTFGRHNDVRGRAHRKDSTVNGQNLFAIHAVMHPGVEWD